MTYGVTGCRGSLLSWGRRRHQAEHSRQGENHYPHENLPPNARQNKCGVMLDLPLRSIHLSFAWATAMGTSPEQRAIRSAQHTGLVARQSKGQNWSSGGLLMSVERLIIVRRRLFLQ
jgi:hypothetical protein